MSDFETLFGLTPEDLARPWPEFLARLVKGEYSAALTAHVIDCCERERQGRRMKAVAEGTLPPVHFGRLEEVFKT